MTSCGRDWRANTWWARLRPAATRSAASPRCLGKARAQPVGPPCRRARDPEADSGSHVIGERVAGTFAGTKPRPCRAMVTSSAHSETRRGMVRDQSSTAANVTIASSSRKPLCLHSMLRNQQNQQYTVEIVRSGNLLSPWGWEIYRNGKPLPARLLDSGFKSERTAKLASNVALREFLSGLAREETKPD
jgi:hypothetical protein